MIQNNQILSAQEIQIMRDKRCLLLKNLLYKYQLPIKDLLDKVRQDNFIAFSIVKKVSKTGWFSNQRLLVLDCGAKQIFYLSKVPDFIIDESDPFQIEHIRSSPIVKQRISLHSIANQIRQVYRNQNTLTIQWQNQLPQNVNNQNKKWIFQMTSSQLAKDWANLIEIIQKGKFQNPSTLKKNTVIPENLDEIRKKANNLLTTPKSISDTPSIQMKSQNLNFQYSRQVQNNNQLFMTPKNQKETKVIKAQNQNKNYFSKNKVNQTVNKNQQASPKKQSQQNIEQNPSQKILFSQISKQLNPKVLGENILIRSQFVPLSQQIKQPIELQFGKIRKNTGRQVNGNNWNRDGNRISLNLYKKYNIPSQSVIRQVNQDFDEYNMVSEQLRAIKSRQTGPQAKSSQESLKFQSIQNPSSQKQLYSANKANQQKNGIWENPTFWNTYNPINDLPKLDSSYDWNEIYFGLLTEYYSLSNSENDENKQIRLFDAFLKLEKHVEKFQLYCSKGIRNFVDQKILNFDPKKTSKTFPYLSNNKLNNFKQQVFSCLTNLEVSNVFNQHYESFKGKLQTSPNEKQNTATKQQAISSKENGVKEPDKNIQKIISFEFEGIIFKVIIDQDQFHDFINYNGKKYPQKSALFNKLKQKMKQQWDSFFNISYLHPYFIEKNKSQAQYPISYFHIFTPMVVVIEFHGLKFYCQAEFDFQPYKKYIPFDLNPESVSKQVRNHLNINSYLKEKLNDTAVSYFWEDRLVQKIESINLCKEVQKHNYFVVDKIKHLKEIQSQTQDQKDLLISTNKKSQQRADFKKMFTFEEASKKQNLNFASQNLTFQQFLKKNHKFLEVFACIHKQFLNNGGIKLTVHQTFKKFLKGLIHENILTEFCQISKFYDLIANKTYLYKDQLTQKQDLKFLFDPCFFATVIKMIQNEIIICMLLEEINLVTRNFLANLHIATQKNKFPPPKNQDEIFQDIYRSFPGENQSQRMVSLPIFIKQFDWLNLKQKQSIEKGNKNKNFVQLKHLRNFTNNEISKLILHTIVNKAMNQIFLFQQQKSNQFKQIQSKKIKISSFVIHWLINFSSGILEQKVIESMDINFIYEGLMFELNIQRYFDPVSINKKSLYTEYRKFQTPKNQVEKLIKDPYFSSARKLQNQIVSFQIPKQQNKRAQTEVKQKEEGKQEIEYISRLNQNNQKSSSYGYGIMSVNSLKDSFPLSLLPRKIKLLNNLQEIYNLILDKDFNQAIEIYYLLIDSNQKTNSIYEQYFKNIKLIKEKQDQRTPKNDKKTKSMKFQNTKGRINQVSPALLMYVLATQCVAYAFLHLLYYKQKNPLQKNIKSPNQKNRRSPSKLSETHKFKHSEEEITQYQALILKYNDMSYFGSQIIYGKNHIVYFVNQAIFAFSRIMKKQYEEARQYFEQCEKTVLSKPEFFQEKYIIIPVLYFKACNDLRLQNYRSAILSVRILMKCVFLLQQQQKNKSRNNNGQNQYWLQPHFIKLFQNHIPQLQKDSFQDKSRTYNHLGFQILINCNEKDPSSDTDNNRQKLKNDIINQLKTHSQVNDRFIDFLKLLWSLECKNMTDERKWIIKRALTKLYNTLIRQKNLKKQFLKFNISLILNPQGNQKFSLGFLFVYSLFEQILKKSDKYFNFIIFQFEETEYKEFFQYLSNQNEVNFNYSHQTRKSLQHYDLKKELFKNIILMVRFILMVEAKFVFQTMTNS